MCLSSELCPEMEKLVDIAAQQALRTLLDLGVPRLHQGCPQVFQGQPAELLVLMPEELDSLERLIVLDFDGGLTGRAVLAVSHEGADHLATLLCRLACLDQPSDAEREDLFQDVAQLLLHGLVGSLANALDVRIVAQTAEGIGEPCLPTVLSDHPAVVEHLDARVFLAVAPFETQDQQATGALFVLLDPVSLLERLPSAEATTV